MRLTLQLMVHLMVQSRVKLRIHLKVHLGMDTLSDLIMIHKKVSLSLDLGVYTFFFINNPFLTPAPKIV